MLLKIEKSNARIEVSDTGIGIETGEIKKIFSEHPKIGHDLIANLPHLAKAAKIIAYQNKHYDFCMKKTS